MRELLRHLFLPHETNNHRAKVLHVDFLAAIVLFVGLLNIGFHSIHTSYPDILGYATDIRIEELLRAVNEKRQTEGLTPLRLNNQLSQAAQHKALDMFSKNYWAHVSPEGKTPWDFIVASGYRYIVAGENLAKNFSTSQAVVEAWMASPTHRDNVMKANYQDIGFAIVNGTLEGEETTLVVQMFGTTPTSLVQAQKSIVPDVSAQEPKNTKAIQPTVVPTQAPEKKDSDTNIPSAKVLTNESGVTQTIPQAQFVQLVNPIIDLTVVTRVIVFGFVGVFLIVFVVDAWISSRRRIVRVAGHNIAHILFFVGLLLSFTIVGRGVIL